MDYYQVLNSRQSEDLSVIKRRYQDLLLKHHPDKNGGVESLLFQQVREAWSHLSSPERRQQYDAQLYRAQLDQDSAVWCTLDLTQFRQSGGDYSFECKCSGVYEIDQEQLDDLRKDGDSDCLIACDSCSLSVLVTLDNR
uniref:DnaJ-like protein subfamily C member 24 n=1 Tax=Acartia pacifica TaxID=335913 RepID=A0A0U2UNN0_ACAPC|nr:DnaJ-like protein subfamily C member 24 [Acartia pacifica]